MREKRFLARFVRVVQTVDKECSKKGGVNGKVKIIRLVRQKKKGVRRMSVFPTTKPSEGFVGKFSSFIIKSKIFFWVIFSTP